MVSIIVYLYIIKQSNTNKMNTIKVIIATVGHKSYYYNSSQNTFQDSDNYSVSDNPAFYDISSEAACEDALKEFGNLTVSLEVVEFNLDTNEFVD